MSKKAELKTAAALQREESRKKKIAARKEKRESYGRHPKTDTIHFVTQRPNSKVIVWELTILHGARNFRLMKVFVKGRGADNELSTAIESNDGKSQLFFANKLGLRIFTVSSKDCLFEQTFNTPPICRYFDAATGGFEAAKEYAENELPWSGADRLEQARDTVLFSFATRYRLVFMNRQDILLANPKTKVGNQFWGSLAEKEKKAA